MAGHSKFKNIQHRKGAQDKKRAREFTRLVREILAAARQGSDDPSQNPRLRTAIQNARAANMPQDNISRALKRSSQDDENYEAIRYEGFGAGGAALIVETLTSNRNRTAANVRAAFAKHGGRLAENNAVAFLFTQLGMIAYPLIASDEERALDLALEAGADDCREEEGRRLFLCPPDAMHEVAAKLEQALGAAEKIERIWQAGEMQELNPDQTEQCEKLLAQLEEDEDVQKIWTNVVLPEAEEGT